MGSIDDQYINACLDQCSDAIVGIRACTHRSAHSKLAVLIFAGQRVILGFIKVFHGNHATQLKGIVHHQNLFDAVLMQQLLH